MIALRFTVRILIVLVGLWTWPTRADQPSADQLAWLGGSWQVSYEDSELGTVTGYATARAAAPGWSPSSIDVVLIHPKTKKLYRLKSWLIFVQDGKVEILLDGQSPPSGMKIPADTDALHVPLGARLEAGVDGGGVSAPVTSLGPKRLTLRFPLPSGGPGSVEKVTGDWEYFVFRPSEVAENRGGRYDDTDGHVKGSESWQRIDPWLKFAAVEKPTFAKGERKLWLTIAGANLPLTPLRKADISINDPLVRVTGQRRQSWRHPWDALDVEIAIKPGLTSEPKQLTVNGVDGIWAPDPPGLEPVWIDFVRPRSETEFDPVTSVYLGEWVRLQADYAAPPIADVISYVLRAPGGEPMRVSLFRQDGQPTHYLSQPIAVGTAAGTPGEAVAMDVKAGDRLSGARVDKLTPEGVGVVDESKAENAQAQPRLMARVTVEAAPPELWPDALRRADACIAGGKAPTKVTNINVFDKITGGKLIHSVAIQREDVAAAILMRDQVRDALDTYASKVNAALKVAADATAVEMDKAVKARDEIEKAEVLSLIALSRKGGDTPLLHMPVTRYDGIVTDNFTLRDALAASVEENVFDGDAKKALDTYFRQAVAEARGKALQRVAQTLANVKAPGECDTVELLRLIGTGFDSVAQTTVPKLMRKARPGEPQSPLYVPDREARARILGLKTLAEAISAQKDYAKLDTDFIIAAVTLPFQIASVGAKIAAYAKVMSTANAAIVAARAGLVLQAAGFADLYIATRDARAFAAAINEVDYAWGVLAVAGAERLDAAQEVRAEALVSLAITGVMTTVPRSLHVATDIKKLKSEISAIKAKASRAGGYALDIVANIRERVMAAPEGSLADVKLRATRDGTGSLDALDSAILQGEADAARTRAAQGKAATSDGDTIALADDKVSDAAKPKEDGTKGTDSKGGKSGEGTDQPPKPAAGGEKPTAEGGLDEPVKPNKNDGEPSKPTESGEKPKASAEGGDQGNKPKTGEGGPEPTKTAEAGEKPKTSDQGGDETARPAEGGEKPKPGEGGDLPAKPKEGFENPTVPSEGGPKPSETPTVSEPAKGDTTVIDSNSGNGAPPRRAEPWNTPENIARQKANEIQTAQLRQKFREMGLTPERAKTLADIQGPTRWSDPKDALVAGAFESHVPPERLLSPPFNMSPEEVAKSLQKYAQLRGISDPGEQAWIIANYMRERTPPDIAAALAPEYHGMLTGEGASREPILGADEHYNPAPDETPTKKFNPGETDVQANNDNAFRNADTERINEPPADDPFRNAKTERIEEPDVNDPFRNAKTERIEEPDVNDPFRNAKTERIDEADVNDPFRNAETERANEAGGPDDIRNAALEEDLPTKTAEPAPAQPQPPAKGMTGQEVTVTDASGKPMQLKFGDKLDAGGVNDIYTVDGRDDVILRVAQQKNSAVAEQDIFGRNVLDNGGLDPSVVRPVKRFAQGTFGPEAGPALEGRAFEVNERLSPSNARRQIADQAGGAMTAGQAIAFDEATRAMNENGYAWIDNHDKNYVFEPKPGKDNWGVIVLDPGGIVPAKGATAAERAANARFIQRTVSAPSEENVLLYQRFKNNPALDIEAALREDFMNQMGNSIDVQKLGIDKPHEIAYRPVGTFGYPDIRTLAAIDDPTALAAAYADFRNRPRRRLPPLRRRVRLGPNRRGGQVRRALLAEAA